MLDSLVLIVPVAADRIQVAEVASVLGSHHIPCHVMEDSPAPSRVLGGRRPSLVVVVGGRIGPELLGTVDAVAHATAHRTPLMALAEHLDEEGENHLLANGARDVMQLPVSATRLRMRILAMLRSLAASGGHEVYRRGPLSIHLGRREVCVGDQDVALTRTEFDLLVALAQDPRRVLSRSELARRGGMPGSDAALESHLSRLRKKLKQADGPNVVESVRGIGYRFESG